MTTLPRPRDPQDHEQKQILRLHESLHERLPDHPVEAIEEQVARVYEEYRDCRVREFLPILVEREVMNRLV
ncbi:three-helix bundle dimerization domain-containing protein [Nocardioides ferulae]|uniref:three-helix bundle dimerization domain-containing protein n=1 Tax=Nocardioides ferulae TaxID=2340821 RepID=UPI0013DE65D4|nr:hypothetical protein [Nocardioides ferulae]